MYPASLLPRSLLALIAATAVHAAPSIHNDPFHHIAIHAPKLQEEPICCLRPLTPQEPVDSDLLLSFEDWKERQLAESQQASSSIPNASVSSTAVPTGSRSNESSSGETGAEPPPTTSSLDISTGSDPSPEPMSPHFQIPITDRFNYASLDCSARVHSTHRGAKSAANILSSKKDRYMLSPCANDPKFIVIELCDDIWIDTVQLANHEFFSGVFRDFTVSVAKTYAVEKTEWTVVGTYTARNVRSVQSFHPPNSLRDFYRFMRIDFHSHYGNEYYCPISLLRVYGLTHLEQWKWDMWEKESKEKLMATELELPLSSEDSPEVPNPAQMADTVSPAPAPTTTAKAALYSAEVPIEDAVEPDEPVFRHSTDIAMSESPLSSATEPSPDLATPPPPSPTPDTPHSLNSTLSISTISTPETPSSPKLVTPTISLAPAAPPAYFPSTGESIYRTIMNRLTALESNTTLYARYVNEQTTAMRDALRRMSEDVGRLEGINRAQAQEVRRTLSDLSRQRRRMEVEQRALAARVAALADDVTLEKRLGVAQLCLLLAVLVFLSVTRGSRGEYADPRTLPGHWASRLRARSLTPTRSPAFAPATPEKEKEANGVPFPTSVTTARPGKRPILGLALPPDGIARQRARTPSRRHQYVVHARGPSTPTSARPSLRRSDSHSSAGPSASMPMLVGPVPRSARMWARTAHLHEVRPKNHDRGMTVRVGRGESIGAIELNEAGEETAWVDTDEGSETDLSLAGRSKCH